MKRNFLEKAVSGLRPKAAELPSLAEGVLVIALGASLAQLSWLLLPQGGARPLPPAASPAATVGASRLPQLEMVAGLHLFGTAAASTPTPLQAPETALNLTLHGVFAASRKESAFAIIAEGGDNERTLRIGDKVAGGAVLRDILPDRVVLEREGRLETLRLPRERLDLAGAAAQQTSTLTPAQTAQLRSLRANVLRDPQEVFRLAALRPVIKDGQLRGYRIEPKQYQPMFQAAGLSPADTIVAVNGIPVTDPGQLGALTAQLADAPQLQLDIERPDGSRDRVVINLN